MTLGSQYWKDSVFILTVFSFLALPALWQLTLLSSQASRPHWAQARVEFPQERRALASVDSGSASENCVLRQKTKSLCGQAKGEANCPRAQTISYWHCKSSSAKQ